MQKPEQISETKDPRVLSVQSSVVYGAVGNKAALFPLQLLGFEADPINSVQLSNHTGYAKFRGQKLEGADMWSLVEGLDANGFLSHYTHLLSGYIGSVSFLQNLVRLVERLKVVNPSLVFVCDPVLGDDDRLYVPAEFVPIYRTQLVPQAFLITPNQTEAELLSEEKVRSLEDAVVACQRLHAMGPRMVVITSMAVESSPDRLIVVASDADPSVQTDPSNWRYLVWSVARVPMSLSGTGDLCAALLLAWLHNTGDDLKTALENSLASVQEVIARTVASSRTELALVRSRDALAQPQGFKTIEAEWRTAPRAPQKQQS